MHHIASITSLRFLNAAPTHILHFILGEEEDNKLPPLSIDRRLNRSIAFLAMDDRCSHSGRPGHRTSPEPPCLSYAYENRVRCGRGVARAWFGGNAGRAIAKTRPSAWSPYWRAPPLSRLTRVVPSLFSPRGATMRASWHSGNIQATYFYII